MMLAVLSISLCLLTVAFILAIRLFHFTGKSLGWWILTFAVGLAVVRRALKVIDYFHAPDSFALGHEVFGLAVGILVVLGLTCIKPLFKRLQSAHETAVDVAKSWKQLADASFEGIAIHQEGEIMQVNSSLCTLFGYSREEVIGRNVLEFVTPELRASVLERIMGKHEGAYETKAVRKDGSVFPVEIQARYVLYEGRTCRIASVKDTSARKLAEEKLLKSLAANRALIDAIPDMVFRVRGDGTFLDYKAPSDNVLFVPANFFVGRQLSEILPSEASTGAQRVIDETLATGETRTFEYSMIDENGFTHHYEARTAVCGSDEVLVLVRDVTSEKIRQVTLEESDSRYRSFIAACHEGIYRCELSAPIETSATPQRQVELMFERGTIVECNEAFAKMYGMDVQSMTNLKISELLDREDLKNWEYLEAFVSSGYRIADAESHEKDVHGDHKYILNNLIGVVEDGKLVRAWGTQRDITQQRLAENKLERQNRELLKLSAAVTQSANMVCLTNTRGVIEYVNPRFLEVTGFRRDEIIGSQVPFFNCESPSDELTADVCAAMNKGERWSGQVKSLKKDGTMYLERVTVSPVYEQSGTIINYLLIREDITNELRANERLLQANVNACVGTMASQLAHELKNCLGGIIGNASFARDSLSEGDETKTTRESLDKIVEIGERANDVISGLLDFKIAPRSLVGALPVQSERLSQTENTDGQSHNRAKKLRKSRILFLSLNRESLVRTFKSAPPQAALLIADNLDKLPSEICSVADMVVLDMNYPGKVELVRLAERCLEQEIPLAFVNGNQADLLRLGLSKNLVMFSEPPEFQQLHDLVFTSGPEQSKDLIASNTSVTGI